MLCDCHMHMILDGMDWKKAIGRHQDGPDIPFIRKVLAQYREQGFTYLRDGGDRWGAGKAAREIAAEYGDRLAVGKINIDDYPALAEQYFIEFVPTLVIFSEGDLIDFVISPGSRDAIAQFIEETL